MVPWVAATRSARNVKLLGGNGAAVARAQGGNNFLACWANVHLYSVVVCIKRQNLWSGSWGEAPWSWNIFSFWTFNERRNFACFVIFKDWKNYRSEISVLSCKKMAFKKSHLGMCMCIWGHFITVKISSGGNRGVGARAKAQRGSSSPLSLPMYGPLDSLGLGPYSRLYFGQEGS